MSSAPLSARGLHTRARLLEAGKTVFERDGFHSRVAGGRYTFDAAVEQLTLLWANALGMRGVTR